MSTVYHQLILLTILFTHVRMRLMNAERYSAERTPKPRNQYIIAFDNALALATEISKSADMPEGYQARIEASAADDEPLSAGANLRRLLDDVFGFNDYGPVALERVSFGPNSAEFWVDSSPWRHTPDGEFIIVQEENATIGVRKRILFDRKRNLCWEESRNLDQPFTNSKHEPHAISEGIYYDLANLIAQVSGRENTQITLTPLPIPPTAHAA